MSWVVEQTFYISVSSPLWGARHDQYFLHSRVLCRSLRQTSDDFLRAFFWWFIPSGINNLAYFSRNCLNYDELSPAKSPWHLKSPFKVLFRCLRAFASTAALTRPPAKHPCIYHSNNVERTSEHWVCSAHHAHRALSRQPFVFRALFLWGRSPSLKHTRLLRWEALQLTLSSGECEGVVMPEGVGERTQG